MSDRPRVVVALPDAAERDAVSDWLLADGLEPVRAHNARIAAELIKERSIDLLIADAALAGGSGLPALVRARNSSASTIVVGQGATPVPANIRHLTRPLDRVGLSCSVWMEILERRPFRRSVRKAVSRVEATVNGVPSHIVDVSSGGLRLELPRDWSGGVPPSFTVRIPLVGVAVRAQRMWMRSASNRLLWCGGALSHNRPSSAQGWQAFVDLVPAPDAAGGPPQKTTLLIP